MDRAGLRGVSSRAPPPQRDGDGNGVAETMPDRALIEELSVYLVGKDVNARDVAIMIANLTLFVRTKFGPFSDFVISADTDDSATIIFQLERLYTSSVAAHVLQAIGNGDVVGRSFIKDVYLEMEADQVLLAIELWRNPLDGDSASGRKKRAYTSEDSWHVQQKRDRDRFHALVKAGLTKAKVPLQRIMHRDSIEKDDALVLSQIVQAICGCTERRCYVELFDPTRSRDTYLLKIWGIDRLSHWLFDALDAAKSTVIDSMFITTSREQLKEYGITTTSHSLQVQLEIQSLERPAASLPAPVPAKTTGKRSRGVMDTLSSAWMNGSDTKKMRRK